MNYLAGVNRILRQSLIIKGDDDEIANFNNLQFSAALNLAKIAIQSELNDLISDRLIPYEKAEGSLTTVASQRLYTLPSDFVRFYGQNAFLYDGDEQIFEVKLDRLRHTVPEYATQTGTPYAWYFNETTTKQLGLVSVPDSSNSGVTWTFDYEKDVSVSNETDTLPFHTESEAQSFIDMANRHFALLRTNADLSQLLVDPVYNRAKAKLINLLNFINPSDTYGTTYG